MYEVIKGAILPNKKAAIERGKAMVAQGKARREVAFEIYPECYPNTDVQASQYQRRIRHIVGLLA